MKKILIIGKNGFVGKSLIEYFSDKTGYDIDAVNSKEMDLLDEESVRNQLTNKHYDVVIDAAVWLPNRADFIDRGKEVSFDLRMYHNLAKYSDYYGKMIYFGSGAEYDKTKPIVSVKEEDFDRDIPHSEYGFAKYAINRHIETTENIYNLRIFGLYGKNEDYRVKFITGACAKAVMGLPISIRQNVYFDFLYVDDFSQMLEKFLEIDKPQYHSYNIVSGRKIDLVSLAKMVQEEAKKKDGIDVPVFVCSEGLANEYTASNERLLKEIGNIEYTSFEKSIHDLYSYFKKNKEQIDIKALLYQG